MKNLYIIISLLLLFFVSSCSDDQENGLGNEGQVVIKVDMGDIPKSITRAELPGIEGWNPAEVCEVEIWQNDECIKSYTGIAAIPGTLTLPIGEYTLKVTAGEEVSASFNDCYYEGETTFSVTADNVTPVSLSCKLKNVLLTIRFTNELKALMGNDFKIEVIGDENSQLEWAKDNAGDTGYYILSDGLTTLSWSVYGNLNGKTISTGKRAGTIASVKPNTNYILTFNYEDGIAEGGADLSFSLEIEEPDPDDDYIDYNPGPQIGGDGFDINNPEPIVEGSAQDVLVTIVSDIAITSIKIGVDAFTQSAFDLDDSSFDFIGMEPAQIASYAAKGIVFESSSLARSAADVSYSIKIAAEKVKDLPVGDYIFDIAVTNEKNKISEATLKLPVVEDEGGNGEFPAATDEIRISDVWAKRATVSATVLAEGMFNYSFDYKVEGASEWSNTPATISGSKVLGNITGLEPATMYEYRVRVGEETGDIKTFTTEEAKQLPNSSFENWCNETKKTILGDRTFTNPNASANDKFWDCGNWGSIAGGATLTSGVAENVIEGAKAAKLESKFVGLGGAGRFAAGNLFVGSFDEVIITGLFGAKTAGGRLSFGREFTSRPTALKGYFKYTNGGGIELDEKVAQPAEIQDGDPDKANIYIALSDKGEPYTIVNTTALSNTLSYFDKTDKNIIAFGEWTQEASTDEMIEFIIPLDYRSLDRIPTHIILVCSSSKYGDYFSGAKGSTLWLDDFELIYE